MGTPIPHPLGNGRPLEWPFIASTRRALGLPPAPYFFPASARWNSCATLCGIPALAAKAGSCAAALMNRACLTLLLGILPNPQPNVLKPLLPGSQFRYPLFRPTHHQRNLRHRHPVHPVQQPDVARSGITTFPKLRLVTSRTHILPMAVKTPCLTRLTNSSP